MPDSQQYSWTLYLINNIDEILFVDVRNHAIIAIENNQFSKLLIFNNSCLITQNFCLHGAKDHLKLSLQF